MTSGELSKLIEEIHETFSEMYMYVKAFLTIHSQEEKEDT